ncbi:MAG TPA: ABC-F family ATP-binding cassette domain-containing protein, partial [Nitrospirota bacterium]|nr:ABC-F family ATP-binding cassette domain-containing protein [Nitrospirota bacterium]
GLVGRNGHGKSTLFRMILGEEHQDSGTITVPSGYTIGHLSQHIHFTEDTVLKEACLALPVNEDHIDESYKAEAILHGLGFTNDDFGRPPSSLSGGYQVRLNLAKVLVSEPNLLLLDEPTNYLDIISVRWLTQFLRAWRNEMIIITHDREFMDSVTTHTMIIHRCKMRKVAGGTQKLYDQILMEEEIYEKTRQNDEKKRKEVEQFINRFRAQATKASAVQSRVKALARHEKLDKLEEIKTLDFKFRSAPFEAKWMMTVEDLSFGFSGDSPKLIDGLSFGVGKKDRIAVIGKNGKGKTTLLNLLAGEMSPTSGDVKLHPNTKIAYFGQTNINRLRPEKTALQEVMDAHPDYAQGESRAICGLMMFEGDNALKKVSVLSGGERSRVLLGKLLVSPANLLMLDEPTNHLDMESIDSLIEAIEVFDGAVIIVTHSELILEAVATKLIVYDNDSVSVFEGTYLDFLDRVGWSDEGGVRMKKGKKQDADRNGNRKDAKKARTGIVADKSKVLGALKKKIATLEEEITKLEFDVEQDTQRLLEVTVKGEALAIKRLSQAMRDNKARIEKLFNELEAVTNEHDAKAQEFDRQLGEPAEIL